METVTITLNKNQARVLAYWVNTFAYEHNLEKDIDIPKYAEYLQLFNAVNNANEQLNPRKVRVA